MLPQLHRHPWMDEEIEAFRDQVRRYAVGELVPHLDAWRRQGYIPREVWRPFGQMGFMLPELAEEHGGAGATLAYQLVVQDELAKAEVPANTAVHTIAAHYILDYGTEAQKKRWLPDLAAGRKIGCFGLTEPDFGSNPAGMATAAKKVKGGYVLNGNKYWITNASTADVSVVWARLDGKIRGFLVEKGTKGCTPEEIKGKYSLRASDTSGIVLEDCLVPEDALLPGGEGLKAPLACLDSARYGIAWGALGAAQACLDEATRYAKTRIQFGKPIASFQLVQNKLAQMMTELTAGQLVAWRLGKLRDEGKHEPAQTSLAKRMNVDLALRAARVARDILGASGITEEYQALRHALNLESVYTYEGTHDIHGLVLGERITGIAAFKG
jgi:glutaryl-CoA dehydrogenase